MASIGREGRTPELKLGLRKGGKSGWAGSWLGFVAEVGVEWSATASVRRRSSSVDHRWNFVFTASERWMTGFFENIELAAVEPFGWQGKSLNINE